MSYTVDDLDKAVAAEFPDGDSYYSEDGWEADGGLHGELYSYRGPKRTYDLQGIGTVELVEEFGGEGEGDQYWYVIKITDDEGNVRHFKRNGWHASYDGGYYEGPTSEVVPVEQMIIVWKDLA